jgi:hypothetical protein
MNLPRVGNEKYLTRICVDHASGSCAWMVGYSFLGAKGNMIAQSHPRDEGTGATVTAEVRRSGRGL